MVLRREPYLYQLKSFLISLLPIDSLHFQFYLLGRILCGIPPVVI
jgi:hypothetical protein